MFGRTYSVIVPSHNEGRNLAATVGYLLRNSGPRLLEVIVVDDGSTDGSTDGCLPKDTRLQVVRTEKVGIATARNAGASKANGAILAFVDAHCFVPPDWLAPLHDCIATDDRIGMVSAAIAGVQEPQCRGCGMTWTGSDLSLSWLPSGDAPHEVPFHAGGCQVVPAVVFRDVGGYDAGMTRWGSEDIELSLRLWLFGYRLVAQPAAVIYHLFRTRHPYSVDIPSVLYNRLRLAVLHFDRQRLGRVIANLQRIPGFESSLARAITDNSQEQRRALLERRMFDMDWFFTRFSMRV